MKEIGPTVYIKGKLTALISHTFIYEVSICARFKGYYSIANTTHFSSVNEIANIVESFYKNPYTEITCELYSAPLSWLIENGFTIYIKPEKKKRVKKIIE